MKTTLDNNMQSLYNDVKVFNEIAGNLSNVTPFSIENQYVFIYEEIMELHDALLYMDDKEMLDATCDIFVTVAGLMQKLEAAGFDVATALQRVNANNLTKFPMLEVIDVAHYGDKATEKKYLFPENVQPPNTHADLNFKYGVVVFKDNETGKIKKPTYFQPVDLSGTYPEGFLKGSK